MSKLLAAFPLSLVCFPGEYQNLHIFEPRYQKLVEDCVNEGISFVLVPVIDGQVFHLGTEVIIDQIVKQYADGKSDITIKGINLVKVSKLSRNFPDRPYPAIKASQLSWDEKADIQLSREIIGQLLILYKLLNIDSSNIPTEAQFLTAKIIHKIGLSVEQELEIYSIPDEKTRQKKVLEHLYVFIPTVQEVQKLKTKAVLNGHFKNIYPSEF